MPLDDLILQWYSDRPYECVITSWFSEVIEKCSVSDYYQIYRVTLVYSIIYRKTDVLQVFYFAVLSLIYIHLYINGLYIDLYFNLCI